MGFRVVRGPISCIERLDFVVLIKNKQASIDIVYYHRLVTSYRWVRFFKVWLVRPQAVLSSTYVDHLSIFRRSFGLHLISVNFWSDWAAIITLDSSSSGILEEENPRSGRIWGCIVFVCWWSIEEHFSEVVTNEWWWCSMVSSCLFANRLLHYQQTLVPMEDWSGLAK